MTFQQTPEESLSEVDAAFRQEILNIAVAEIKSVVQPDSVGDDIRRKSVAFVSIHERFYQYRRFNLAIP